MTVLSVLWRSTRAAAAVEMALVLPLLLVLLFGCLELGNFFMNEHYLVKAVRDGARYAARQDYSDYSSCSGAPGGSVVSDTTNLIKTTLLSGGTDQLPSMSGLTVSVDVSCTTTAGGTTLTGIYSNMTDGAPIVTVTARLPYTPLFDAFGFTGGGLNLNATEQAAVMGL